MALAEYKRKRNLKKTPEPGGGKRSAGELRFVVQKHAASRLHYDFRLELDGVLKSWAVPKGPSLNPADKRLAMMVEDHPMDYRQFEGTIPTGNYGAGTVMVWDEGTYSDADDSDDVATARKNLKVGLMKGDMKFTLHGSKLSGSFVLAKMHTKEDNAWLLIKHKDAHVSAKDVTKQDKSVLTKRSLDEIAGKSDEQWLREPELNLKGAPKKAQPSTIKPMLATLVAEPFNDKNWLYEVKWDGYRIMAHVKGGKVQLKSRGDKDYTQIFAPVAAELKNLKTDCILDGEVVIVDKDGKSDFGALQNYQKTGAGNLAYYVFDAPYAGGRDLRELPLTRRKEIVAAIVEPLERTKYSDHVEGRGIDFFHAAEQQTLEGIMAKQADSTYQENRRGGDWLKVKTHQRQEAVIGGFTEPRGSRKQLGALVLGVYDGGGKNKKLRYVGHTGGGFTEKKLADMYERLHPLERTTSPFSTSFKVNEKVHWVEPTLMAEVKFAEWTGDGHMRQPIFIGLRGDKDAKTVRQETAKEAPKLATTKSQAEAPTTKVELTHLSKVFWPKEGYTKGDLINYYDSVAATILPYLKDRPESMNRHPGGIETHNFFHKDLEQHPPFVKTVPIHSESNNADIHWLLANDRDTLLYMANLGCIELNPWHSRTGHLDKPDYCLIDLDAKTNPFDDIITVAKETHKLLEDLDVPSFAKTSGKTGLHVCIPLGAKYSYDQSKQFAQIVANLVQERLPKLTSVERTPAKRKGKIYLDFLQNRKGQTMAAPYCVRPVAGATVSTPLDWSEVRKGLDPTKYTVKTTGARLEKVGDLWKPVVGKGIDLKRVLSTIQ